MYISSVHITNYRNFKDFTVELQPLTLIIGENNIGKSNLLDSLGLILSQDVSFFKRRMLETSDFNHDCIVDLKKKILDDSCPSADINYPQITVCATFKDWNEDQEAVVADWFSNSDLTEATITYQFTLVASFNKEAEINEQREFIKNYKAGLKVGQWESLSESEKINLVNFPISKYYYSIFGGNQRESQINTYHLNQLKFELLDALRDAKVELVASHHNRLLFRVLNTKEEIEYQNLKSNLIGLQQAIDSNTALTKIKDGITQQLEKISLLTEVHSNHVDFIFAMPEVEDLLKKISLIYGHNPIRIERNGTGRNNLLFISLILSYIEDSTKALHAYYRVIGIEEPEAHLHPNLQDHLASNIHKLIKDPDGTYRKDIQLLLTSHSTQITTKIDFQNCVVLFSQDNETKAHYVYKGFANTAEGRRSIRYLNKFLDAVNTNIFYSRRIILVEGISEKLLIPILFNIHKSESLERHGCCAINVNGLAFRHFLEIIKNGFFIKCLVLTDSDEDTIVENHGAQLASDYAAVSFIKVGITQLTTFEKDLIAANTIGNGRNILLKSLEATRPILSKAYVKRIGNNPIVMSDFFPMIEKYKSEFAYSLMTELLQDNAGFVIPEYIKDGFDFILS